MQILFIATRRIMLMRPGTGIDTGSSAGSSAGPVVVDPFLNFAGNFAGWGGGGVRFGTTKGMMVQTKRFNHNAISLRL